jgi:hypothetical protein
MFAFTQQAFPQGDSLFQKKYFETKLPEKHFDKESWEKIRKEIDYEKEIIKAKKNIPKEKPKKSKWKNPFSFNFFNSNITRLIIYVLAISIIAFIIYKIFVNAPLSSYRKLELEEFPDLDNIEKPELEKLLDTAIGKNDFRMAIRIRFLMIIKELSENRYIVWEKRKTNEAYLLETKGLFFINSFEKSVRIFEITWYGKRPVSETDFMQLEPAFTSLINLIQKKPL